MLNACWAICYKRFSSIFAVKFDVFVLTCQCQASCADAKIIIFVKYWNHQTIHSHLDKTIVVYIVFHNNPSSFFDIRNIFCLVFFQKKCKSNFTFVHKTFNIFDKSLSFTGLQWLTDFNLNTFLLKSQKRANRFSYRCVHGLSLQSLYIADNYIWFIIKNMFRWMGDVV